VRFPHEFTAEVFVVSSNDEFVISKAPDDEGLREQTLESHKAYSGDWLSVQKDIVRLPDGSSAQREYVLHPGAVMIIPLLPGGRLVMERQWRHPLKRVMLEFPAGKLNPGEAPLACAQRELAEETGYRAQEWARAGVLHNAISYSDEIIEIWFARGLVAGASQLDEGEFVELCIETTSSLNDKIKEGLVTDAKTMVGFMWLQNWLSAKWELNWHSC
jgi:ADP-ribose pyrophosphatase